MKIRGPGGSALWSSLSLPAWPLLIHEPPQVMAGLYQEELIS